LQKTGHVIATQKGKESTVWHKNKKENVNKGQSPEGNLHIL